MDIPTDSDLLEAVDAFLARHGMKPTRFGAEATGEPQLLSSIRDGRSPSLKVWRRVAAYIRRKDAELAANDHADPDTGQGARHHG